MSAGNPLLGTATFLYPADGGQEYRLTLNNRVWIEAEDVLGYSILDAVEELRLALKTGRNPRLKVMCAIVYGGLRQHHADVTETDVVDMFMSGEPDFKEAVLKAMRGAQLPDTPDDASGNGAAPQGAPTSSSVGTGSGSSSPGVKPATPRKASGKKLRVR
ncbi:hypothetical protein HNO88_000506 [Novosphingobium chloroacetimidivorans]|uniref:Uncharacterized protein n=1 Tax=Novosphingobium chloroacetimidivorans TaxID=1428314 RepID=A0A7W7K7K1_9SPHN|nr:hypothetical protein [Novosphingobium chloroacetimidivorans]MBB4857199.1 hypothetical protein [Novosphingobium chloroacetimidivorans]